MIHALGRHPKAICLFWLGARAPSDMKGETAVRQKGRISMHRLLAVMFLGLGAFAAPMWLTLPGAGDSHGCRDESGADTSDRPV